MVCHKDTRIVGIDLEAVSEQGLGNVSRAFSTYGIRTIVASSRAKQILKRKLYYARAWLVNIFREFD